MSDRRDGFVLRESVVASTYSPPETEVRRVYQPVEIRGGGGDWVLGLINARWRGRTGEDWCRYRVVGGGPAEWAPFDPNVFVELPLGGT
ncbi:hypothetical protein [Streptomyces sp. SID3343]|uniref:hypothetical protein n=1 Tax=Streptomyces sp. SID3343 TaxID=2690260 RepID=UPI00136EBCAF|nr:hypothetical protein [Streptomyces sp. SID3343]MYW00029.1 hypothetical protein [Streptomyces sp. SID3343]